MQTQILKQQQLEMLPLISRFSQDFYLVGGTALALQLGHRRSIDFDLFTTNGFDNQVLRSQIRQSYQIQQVLIENKNELTMIVNGVKLTFYHYPYEIEHKIELKDVITMPNPLVIAAMKAFALGKRARWKDYVDLYFIFQDHSLVEVVAEAESIFTPGEFNERLFREQLAYYEDINYTEAVEYLPGFEVSEAEIKQQLQEISLTQITNSR